MADSITPAGAITTNISQLVALYRTTLEKPLKLIKAQKAVAQSTIEVLSTLLTKLQTLRTEANNLRNTTISGNPFQQKIATSSNTSVVTASAANEASKGTHTITINQLAKNYYYASKEYTSSGTDISAAVGAGTKQFQIEQSVSAEYSTWYNKDTEEIRTAVGDGTRKFSIITDGVRADISITIDATTNTNEEILTAMKDAIEASAIADKVEATVESDGDNRRLKILSTNGGDVFSVQDITGTLADKTKIRTTYDISVEVAAGETNETVLTNIANAINSSDANVNATVVHQTEATSRLVLQSKITGFEAIALIKDTSGTLIQTIEANNAETTKSSNGYKGNEETIRDKMGDGTYTFSISINGITDYNISVTIDGTTTNTNSKILDAIANAIKASAVKDEVTATVESVDANVKLKITSTNENDLFSVQDISSTTGNKLCEFIAINTTQAKTDSAGGYMYKDSELNSLFELNGLNIERTTNIVNDVVTGVTFNLLSTGGPATVTVGLDIKEITADVQAFLDAYNDVIDYLNEVVKTKEVSEGVFERGALAGHPIYARLYSKLRRIMAEEVQGVSNPNYEQLYQIGITVDSSGHYSITDTGKFENALESAVTNVSELFQLIVDSENRGKAAKIYEELKDYVETGGRIDDSKSMEQDKIEHYDNRIEWMQSRIDRRVEAYEKRLGALQEMLAALQYQYYSLQMFYGLPSGTGII